MKPAATANMHYQAFFKDVPQPDGVQNGVNMRAFIAICLVFAASLIPAMGQTNMLSNPGFESGTASWVFGAQSFIWSSGSQGHNSSAQYTYFGVKADGSTNNPNVTSTFYQSVNVPSNATALNLSFYVKITSDDTSGVSHDYLFVEVRDSSGTVQYTPVYFTNVNASGVWVAQAPSLPSAYAGQTIQIAFHGVSNTDAVRTVFRIDDVSLTATTTLPDMTKSTDSITTTSPHAGDTVTASLTVQNLTAGTAGAFHVGFYWSSNSAFSGATLLVEQPVAGCAGNGTVSLNQNITIASNTSPGIYYLGYKIDDQAEVSEGNESNNGIYYWTITVPAPPADLVSQSISVAPDPATAGGSVTVSYTVANTGGTAAPASHTKVQIKDASNVLLTEQTFATNAISANSTTTESRTLSLNGASVGTYYAYVKVDTNSEVVQSNTANDLSSGVSFTVNLPNLPAPTLSTPANGSTGQSTTPSFAWSSVAGATSYRIIVATNAADLPTDPTAATGGATVVINTTTTTNSYTPTAPLNAGTTYYWVAHGRNSNQFGTWSSTSGFSTVAAVTSLTIIPTFDVSIEQDPNAASIKATIYAAIAQYSSHFSDPITVYITFAKDAGISLGQSSWNYKQIVTYSDYRAALVTHASSSDDAAVLAHLPSAATNPVNGSALVYLKLPLARALGLEASPPPDQMQPLAESSVAVVLPSVSDLDHTDSSIVFAQTNDPLIVNMSPGSAQSDGTISLNTAIMNLTSSQTDPNNYSLFSVVCHEINELLGLGSALQWKDNGANAHNGDPPPTGAVLPQDFFRYDANGNRSFTTALSATSYFSLDGTNHIARFNQVDTGDFADWYSSGGQIPQVQDAFQTRGSAPVLGVEFQALDAIGFHRILSTYTIDAAAGSGGVVSPNGSLNKNAGDVQTYVATPSSNYVVNQWLVDGALAQSGGTTFTLYNIQSDHSVQVNFTYVPPQFIVIPSAGSNGAISPSTPQTVSSNGGITFTASPSLGYMVDTWSVNGAAVVGGGTSFSLSSITADQSVSVTFKVRSFVISPSAGANGLISPASAQNVAYGGSTILTATPNSGYLVDVWSINGVMTQSGGDSLTISNVTANATVSVSFRAYTASESWRQQYFHTSSNTGEAADFATPQGDGIANLLKFATAMDPTKSGVWPGKISMNGGSLIFTYVRNKAAVADGVSYSVEWSDSLVSGSWSTSGVSETSQDQGGTETVSINIPSGASGHRFVRLRVSRF